MFIISFKVTIFAILEIFILGLIGFILVKRRLLSQEGLDNLTHLVIYITLPLFIITRVLKNFRFSLYPDWWLYPVLSIIITILGFLVAALFIWSAKTSDERRQFLSLVGFQNSGYLPLALVAALLPEEQAGSMFIYIFLFLVGFNLLIWSLGPYMLSSQKPARFEFGKLFSPPIIATFVGLALVFPGGMRLIPDFVFRPLKMAGDCTLPLAIFVIGGNLAEIKFKGRINKKAVALIILAKLILMPLIVLLFLARFKVPYLLGLLLIIQAAMPSATSLSIIIRQTKAKDYLINPSIFIGHIIAIFSIPLFLTLFFSMVK